jgi:hypothetical protein
MGSKGAVAAAIGDDTRLPEPDGVHIEGSR